MTTSVLSRYRRATATVPYDYRRNFRHLYWDIAWYGLLAGSSISFLAVYAARIGASAFEIGLLTAGPAAVSLIATMPFGQWLVARPVGKSTFWMAVFFRLGYFFWIFVPLLGLARLQIWSLIILVLVTSIPGTALAIGFNALYAAAVPPEWRGHVAGIRHALLAASYIVSSLLCGMMLDVLPFTLGYQVVFALGFLGATMSTVHLFGLRNVQSETEPARLREPTQDFARPGTIRGISMSPRLSVGLRSYVSKNSVLRVDVLQENGYGGVVFALFCFHFAQYLPGPLFALRWVDQLGFSDKAISLGTAVFYATVLLGALQLPWLTERFGHHRLTVAGALLLSTYPLMTALMTNVPLYLLASIMGGLAWAIVGGALANYLLERVPPESRAPYLAWYNMSLSAAILTASLLGPLLANQIGIVPALLVAFVLRMLAGIAIWRIG